MKQSFLALCMVVVSTTMFAQSRIVQNLGGESWVAYRMVHPLHVIDAKSTSVDFKLELDPTTKEIKTVTAQVDVTTFDSGNSNRDSHAMEVIDAMTYPDVEFTSTSIAQNADSLFVTGKLTFHGITKDILLAATTRWQPNRLDVQGKFDIGLTEFKVDRPALLLIPVEDKLSFTLAAAFAWK